MVQQSITTQQWTNFLKTLHVVNEPLVSNRIYLQRMMLIYKFRLSSPSPKYEKVKYSAKQKHIIDCLISKPEKKMSCNLSVTECILGNAQSCPMGRMTQHRTAHNLCLYAHTEDNSTWKEHAGKIKTKRKITYYRSLLPIIKEKPLYFKAPCFIIFLPTLCMQAE